MSGWRACWLSGIWFLAFVWMCMAWLDVPWLGAASAWAEGQVAVTPPQLPAPSRTRIDMQAQLEAAESSLQYNAQVRLAAIDGGLLDFDRDRLELPLLSPVVGGAVLDRGAVPAGAQTVQAEADAPLRIERTAGGLVVRGVLPAGAVATVRVRSVIGFREPHLQLGLRGTAGRTWTSVVVLTAAPARVQLAVSAAARISALEQGNERVTGAALARPLARGQIVTFDLDGLPAVAVAPRVALAKLALVLLLAAVASLVWVRRRRALPRSPAGPAAADGAPGLTADPAADPAAVVGLPDA